MGTHADINERKRAKADGTHANRPLGRQLHQERASDRRTPLNALMGLPRLLMDSPLNPDGSI